MPDQLTGGRPFRILATAAWLVIVIAGMRAGASFLVPLFLAIFIGFTCAPAVLWLERKRVHPGISVPLVIIGIILVGLAIGAVTGASLSQFSIALPRYQAALRAEMASLLRWAQDMGLQMSTEEVLAYVDPGAAMRLGARMLRGLGEILTDSFLILIAVTFFLFEASAFRHKVFAIWGEAGPGGGRFGKIAEDVYHFLAIKTAVSLATGLFVGAWVAIMGIDFPLLWGLLAFLLNYIPNLGSIIAGAPAVLLASIQYGLGRALLVALGYFVVNVSFGTFLEPRLLGRRLGLSTLAVFLSLIFWGWVLGPVGMILSVPLTMVLKIALETSEDTRWVAILMGPASAARSTAAAAPPQSEKDPEVSPGVPPLS